MIRRTFEIIAYPFHLIYLMISFPFKVLKIILDDRKAKRASNINTKSKPIKDVELLQIGQLLFPKNSSEFETFFNFYLTDYKRFIYENQKLLNDYNNLEKDKLKATEVIYIYGNSKGFFLMTDWKGEENKREIEHFFETKLQIKIDWAYTNKLRESIVEEKCNDGKYITELLKTIDKDLAILDKKLIFLDLQWDAYVYTAIDQTLYHTITDKFGAYFHGMEKRWK